MDAATLYVVLTLPSGERRTSTQGYATWRACWAHIELLQDMKRADPEAPIASFRCELNKPVFGLIICDRHGRSCEHLRPTSGQGCIALRWVAHMRNRNKFANCYKHPHEDDRRGGGWNE
jgi:hypothetical protein